MVSFINGQRTPEIGIRLALAALPAGVMWMVLRQTVWLAVGGVAMGLALAGAWFPALRAAAIDPSAGAAKRRKRATPFIPGK